MRSQIRLNTDWSWCSRHCLGLTHWHSAAGCWAPHSAVAASLTQCWCPHIDKWREVVYNVIVPDMSKMCEMHFHCISGISFIFFIWHIFNIFHIPFFVIFSVNMSYCPWQHNAHTVQLHDFNKWKNTMHMGIPSVGTRKQVSWLTDTSRS